MQPRADLVPGEEIAQGLDARNGATADNPTHRRTTSQAVGAVHVLIATEAAEDGLTARITLRVPESLKASIEVAANREGVSVNSWLVRALSRGVAGPVQRSGKRLRGYAQS